MASIYNDPRRGCMVIDNSRFGRRITYNFPCEVKPKSFDKEKERVLKAHDAVVASLTPSQRSSMDGRSLRELVKKALLMAPSELKELTLSGLKLIEESDDAGDDPLIKDLLAKFVKTSTFKREKTERHLLMTTKSVDNLIRFFGKIEVCAKAISKDDIYSYMEWRTKNRHPRDRITGDVSRSTILKEVSVLLQTLQWTHDELGAECRTFDAKAFRMRANASNTKMVESLSVVQQKEILVALGECDEVMHDVVLLLLLTGIRSGEIHCFKSKVVNFDSRTYPLHTQSVNGIRKSGKTANSSRSVEVTATLQELLKRGNIYKVSEAYNKDYLRTRLQVLYKSGRIPFKVAAHQFRHSFCTNRLCAGEGVFVVSQKMGHASIQITADRYAKQGGQRMSEHDSATMKAHLNWLENDYFKEVAVTKQVNG